MTNLSDLDRVMIDSIPSEAEILTMTLDFVRDMKRKLTVMERQLTASLREECESAPERKARITASMEKVANKLRGGEELMSIQDLLVELGISRGTLRRMRQSGTLPEPVKVSERRLAFKRSEIAAWLRAGGARGSD